MTIDATLPATVPAPTTEEIMAAHVGGKLSTGLTAPLRDDRDLAISYTPGVAEVSRAIAADGGSPRATRGRSASSPWSATALPCSVSATSARAQRCR